MKNHEHTPELAGTLTAYHFPETSVSLYLGEPDGTSPLMEGYVTLNNAFWRYEGPAPNPWIVVYTEHLGYFVFRAENVMDFRGQREPEKLTESVQAMLDNPLDDLKTHKSNCHCVDCDPNPMLAGHGNR